MVRTVAKQRTAWEDKFRTPAFEDLRAHYNKPVGHLADLARGRLLAFGGIREEVSWQGIPWRWTLTYLGPGAGDEAFAYLILNPAAPQLSVPLPAEMVSTLPLRRFSRFIRDGIVFASRVRGVSWASWSISSKGQIEEVIEIATLKHRFQSGNG